MRLILVGGFLGAGKTTLLALAAKVLSKRGLKVGLITNDQAPDLVDTALLSRDEWQVREVAGSCFCCNFSGFSEAVQSLADGGADVVVAEPVGSCTDLSATIVHPLKKQFPDWQVAPLSVMIDPTRVQNELLKKHSSLHPDASYILQKQLDEADRILLSKADTLTAAECGRLILCLEERFPHAVVQAVSATNEEGTANWLDAALTAEPAVTPIASIDYDRYANGEAVLGWLNARVELTWVEGAVPGWEVFARHLMTALGSRLAEADHEIGHIKLLVNCSGGQLASSKTSLLGLDSVRVDGNLDDPTAFLIVNARVQISPDELEAIFRESLLEAAHDRATSTVRAIHCIKPGRPVPTYRFGEPAG